MAIDPNVTLVTVTGEYVDFEGTPIVGQIKFTLSDMLRNSIGNQMIAPSTITTTLDSNGQFSVQLPATNDPDVIPTDFDYTVEESFPSGRTYTISVPYDTVGSLDLADISPDPTTTVYVSLVTRVPWDTLTALIDVLDTKIDQDTDTFLLSGAYWYIGAEYATYTAVNAAFATYTLLNSNAYEITASDIVALQTSAEAAATSASNSASSVSAISSNQFNSLLLIGA